MNLTLTPRHAGDLWSVLCAKNQLNRIIGVQEVS